MDIIFKALLIVTKSRCNGRGGSPLSQHTDVFGEDLNAPVHNLNPRVWIGSRDFKVFRDAELYIGLAVVLVRKDALLCFGPAP